MDDIGSLSYTELQEACRTANLSPAGSKSVLRRRLQGKRLSTSVSSADETEQPPRKKRQTAISEELLCPITHELPFEPVTAEDGRIYERAAIEQHIRMHQTNTLRSPVTNNPMGPKLLPSPQFKNLIETLIAQRSIEGDLRDAWKLKAQQKTNMECMLQQANSGDAAAAHAVYRHYKHGKAGFPQDYARALHWLKVAHRAGNFKATATLGATFVDGKIGTYPVPRNAVEGMAFLSLAAHHGSDLAAQALGSCFTHGRYGLTVDTTVATYWLEKCLDGSSCRLKHLSTTGKARAQADLEQCRRIAGRAAGVDHPHNDDTFSGSDVDSLGVCPDQNAS